MVVSGFEKNLAVLLRTTRRWPRGFMTLANLIQIRLRCRRIQNGSLRKGNLPGRIWHGLGGDSLGTMAVKKMTSIGSDLLIVTGPNVLPE